jgi:hypothetical protein
MTPRATYPPILCVPRQETIPMSMTALIVFVVVLLFFLIVVRTLF